MLKIALKMIEEVSNLFISITNASCDLLVLFCVEVNFTIFWPAEQIELIIIFDYSTESSTPNIPLNIVEPKNMKTFFGNMISDNKIKTFLYEFLSLN